MARQANRYENLVAHGEAALRSGQVSSVARELSELNAARVPRKWRLPIANLCRRAGVVDQGMRLLFSLRKTGAPSEIAEYAILLHRKGVTADALEILKGIDSVRAPEAMLYRSFCHFARWEHAEAASALESYLKTELTPYARTVGEANLALALVACDRANEARALLGPMIETARATNQRRILANALEVRAAADIHAGQYAEAARDLEEARVILGDAQTHDQLTNRKWRAVLAALSTGNTHALEDFRKDAVQRQQWESVRDADFYLLKARFDQATFDFLIFGTPHQLFRDRTCAALGKSPSKAHYRFGQPTGPCLNLETGVLEGMKTVEPLDAGSVVHRCVDVLLRDFYRPRSLGEIFAGVFPGENFDIVSSPLRVHQVLHRTREWLAINEIPAAISHDSGRYMLSIDGGFAVIVELERKSTDRWSHRLRLLERAINPGELFTAREACEKVGLSPNAFKQLARWAVENGMIERWGASSQTAYRFASRQAA